MVSIRIRNIKLQFSPLFPAIPVQGVPAADSLGTRPLIIESLSATFRIKIQEKDWTRENEKRIHRRSNLIFRSRPFISLEALKISENKKKETTSKAWKEWTPPQYQHTLKKVFDCFTKQNFSQQKTSHSATQRLLSCFQPRVPACNMYPTRPGWNFFDDCEQIERS